MRISDPGWRGLRGNKQLELLEEWLLSWLIVVRFCGRKNRRDAGRVMITIHRAGDGESPSTPIKGYEVYGAFEPRLVPG